LTEHQKDALRALARQVMTQLELRRHLALQADVLAEREAVERRLAAAYAREKRIAETLQRSMLLKPRAGAFPGLAVDMIYEAAWDEAQVGGDFFDAFALGEGRVALVVGDVSGKGLQAAALTAEVKFALRVYLREAGSPSEALRRLNDYLCEPRDPAGSGDAPGTSFVTIALAVVEPEHGRVRIAGGGTEPILIARRGREELGEPVTVEPVKPDGFPLGIERGAAYPGAEAHLGSGDLLLMMTDGVTEARHAGEFFGMEGVEQSVREILAGGGPGAAGGVPDPLEVAERVRDAARDFARGTLRDDACVLVARRDRR
jgi:serine phosphatase RsbU (regulator of sigma subunit)